jgi:hypothetical protein
VVLDDATSEIYYAYLADRPLVSLITRYAAMTRRVDSASTTYTAIPPGILVTAKRGARVDPGIRYGWAGRCRRLSIQSLRIQPRFLESLQNKAKTGIDL